MALSDRPVPKPDVLPRGVDRRSVGLWFGLLAGPLASLADVAVSEAYVEHVETGVQRAWLLGFAGIGVVICVAAGIIAARIGKKLRDADEPDAVRERAGFMATAGVIGSAFSLIVLLAMLVPKLLAASGGAS